MRAPAVVLATAAAFLLPGVSLSGQIAQRVANTNDGTIRIAYDLKPGVEVCDRGIRSGGERQMWRSNGRYDPGVCVTDVVEVDVEIRDGLVRGVEVVRPSESPPADLRGQVERLTAAEAVDFLLGLARTGASPGAAEDAVFPATVGDTEGTWRQLIELARDGSVHRSVRKNALFWVGQEAAEAATAELSDVALADDEEQEVREAAIFALSQRPENQAIGSLIEIARTAEQAESRKSAMFWLAQSEDERVVSFFEDILLGRNR